MFIKISLQGKTAKVNADKQTVVSLQMKLQELAGLGVSQIPNEFVYIDPDGDEIVIMNDEDLHAAVEEYKHFKMRTLRLFVRGDDEGRNAALDESSVLMESVAAMNFSDTQSFVNLPSLHASATEVSGIKDLSQRNCTTEQPPREPEPTSLGNPEVQKSLSFKKSEIVDQKPELKESTSTQPTPSQSTPAQSTQTSNLKNIMIVHEGVQCNKCKQNPIVGDRFKSVVRPNFDLCTNCHNLPEFMDDFYIRIPAGVRSQVQNLLSEDKWAKLLSYFWEEDQAEQEMKHGKHEKHVYHHYNYNDHHGQKQYGSYHRYSYNKNYYNHQNAENDRGYYQKNYYSGYRNYQNYNKNWHGGKDHYYHGKSKDELYNKDPILEESKVQFARDTCNPSDQFKKQHGFFKKENSPAFHNTHSFKPHGKLSELFSKFPHENQAALNEFLWANDGCSLHKLVDKYKSLLTAKK